MKIFKLLCILFLGGVLSACLGGEARLVGTTECVDDDGCSSGQCVDFTCVGGIIDTKRPDASAPDANLPDTNLPDTNLPDATDDPDACSDPSCEDIICDPPLFWDAAAEACVQCQSNIECTELSASTCDAQGACVACTSDAHCAHLGGTPLCGAQGACVACTSDAHCAHLGDTPLCIQGTCSQCTAEDESLCGPNACNPATHTCTNTARGSVFTCKPCLSDSECAPDHACVPMDFKGVARQTNFCLPVAADKPEVETGCEAPFPNVITRLSASGVTLDICTLNEQLTTCEAMLQYGARCADASECGAQGLFDSLCEPIDFEPAACTFPCSSSEECPTNSEMGCMEGAPDIYYCGAY